MRVIVIPYVEDTSKWEDWQRDYRFGLILIMPPPEVSQEIDLLRAKYDLRSAAYCGPHISLSDPLSQEMTPNLINEINNVTTDVQPFTLYYDKPHASTKHAGVSYPIRPREPIDDLKQRLHGTSAFSGEAYRRRNIAPHMTVAEFISIDESLELCARLQNLAPSGSFLCDKLELVVPDESFRFKKRGTFFLGDSGKNVNTS